MCENGSVTNRGEDVRNEMRMLGGVELLQEIILRWPNNIKLRTNAQRTCNRLMNPRTKEPVKRKIKRIVSTKKAVKKVIKKMNILKQWKIVQALIWLGARRQGSPERGDYNLAFGIPP